MPAYRLLFFMLCLCGFHFLEAQNASTSETPYSPEVLREDLQLLRHNIEKIHTALYLYTPKDSLDQVFDQIEQAIQTPMTSLEFYRSLLPLLAYIRNGHSNILPPQAYISQLSNELPRFPFDLYWDRDSLFVVRNLSDNLSIEPGFKILKINGEKAEDLFAEFSSNITRDGYNQSMPRQKAISAFKSYYALFRGTPEQYTLLIENTRGNKTEKVVPGRSMERIKKVREERYGKQLAKLRKPTGLAYTLSIEGKVATMTLPTFRVDRLKKIGQNYKKFFANAFAEMEAAGVEHLILDMRDNGGGDHEPTIALFAHLYGESFRFYQDMKLITRRIPNPKLYDGGVGAINLISWTFVKKKGADYQLRSLKKANKPWKVKTVYSGKVYALMNPSSFSATGEMLGFLKEHDRAVFIGEESGGNPVSNTSGAMLRLELPNSKVQAIIPIVQFVMNVSFENTGRGVLPDHFQRNSIEAEIAGEDSVMEFTLDLIKNGQNK